MKKVIGIITVFIFLFFIAGCSKDKGKSEDELREEIRAELENEAESSSAETTKVEKQQTVTTESIKTLKTFDSIYDGTHLVEAIEYFDENYQHFSDTAKKEFAQEICSSLQELGMNFSYVNEYIQPPAVKYDLKKGMIYVNTKGESLIVDTLREIDESLFVPAMQYWASEGDGVQEMGFALTIRPDVAGKLQRALEIVFSDESPEYYSLSPIIFPNVDYTSEKEPFNSYEAISGYAQVYIGDSEQLKLFDNDNVWKTIVILPLEIEYMDEPIEDEEPLIESWGIGEEETYFKYKANTNVYFDLDDDGLDEEIMYDSVEGTLNVNGFEAVDTGGIFVEKGFFIIVKYIDEFDTRMNMIGVIDYGPSWDVETSLYSIIAPMGEKWFGSVGAVPGEVVPPSKFDEENIDDFNYKAVLRKGSGIEAPVRLDVMPQQTWWGRGLFTYYTTYSSMINYNMKYGGDYETRIELTVEKDVTAYDEKDVASKSSTIKGGQKVFLLATDNEEWIAMFAEDTVGGWVSAEDVNLNNFSGFTVFD